MAGQTARSFTAAQNGLFAVQITDSGCIGRSECVAILTVGLDETDLLTGFRVYPNPTRGSIRIAFNTPQEDIGVRVFSLVGNLIESKNIYDSSDVQLEINDPAGVYFIELPEASGRKAVIRIVKEL